MKLVLELGNQTLWTRTALKKYPGISISVASLSTLTTLGNILRFHPDAINLGINESCLSLLIIDHQKRQMFQVLQ